MSFYVYEFDIPANTPANAPLVQALEVDNPILRRVEINIPNGHQGLAFLQISSLSRVLIPTPGSSPMFVRGDGDQMEIFPNVDLDGPKWKIVFTGYNLDTVNDHVFLINMDVEAKPLKV